MESDLTDRDWRILRYIKENPGTSREGVVRGMNGDPSRITVLKILDNLEKNRLIVVTKAKPNSQIHQLYINEKDLFVTISQNTDDFKQVFFILLDKSIKKITNGSRNNIVDICFMILREYTLFYYNIVGLYITYGITLWSDKIKDSETMSKLYNVIFSQMTEIQMKLFDISEGVFDEVSSRGLEKEYYDKMPKEKFVIDPSIWTPKFMTDIIEKSEKYGLRKETESVLDIAWKIGLDISPPTQEYNELVDYANERGLKSNLPHDDWRKIVRVWKYQLEEKGRQAK